jgi:hypothetical protein
MMKKVYILFLLFVLSYCVSCDQNSPDTPVSTTDAEFISIEGSMFYNMPHKRWQIQTPVASDTVKIYVVRGNYKIELPTDSYESSHRNVQATGFCVKAENVPYTLHDPMPLGAEFIFYYIELQTLKY